MAWQRRMHDAGWAGINWPKEHGGRGAPLMGSSSGTRVCAVGALTSPWDSSG
jgi:alkylation response protein AidB-like acyl-CoA dehydrogenase